MHYIFFKPPFFSAQTSGSEYCQLRPKDGALVTDILPNIATKHGVELSSLRLLNIPRNGAIPIEWFQSRELYDGNLQKRFLDLHIHQMKGGVVNLRKNRLVKNFNWNDDEPVVLIVTTEKYLLTYVKEAHIEAHNQIFSHKDATALIEMLTINISCAGIWTEADVKENASFCSHHTPIKSMLRRKQEKLFPRDTREIPLEITEYIKRLIEPRSYQHASTHESAIDYASDLMGKNFQQVFNLKVSENKGDPTLVSLDEFHAFSTGIKHFCEWAPKISGKKGSSVKEALFTALFCIAPGLTGQALDESTKYKQNLEIGLKLYVRSKDTAKIAVYKPRPDSCRVADSTGLAVYINEVVSDTKKECDRWRMLCQAIVITRIGQYYTGKDKRFCTSALYVTNKLQLEWYILYLERNKVIITKDIFDIQGGNEEMEPDAYTVRLMLQNLAYETLPQVDMTRYNSAKDLLDKLSIFLRRATGVTGATGTTQEQ